MKVIMLLISINALMLLSGCNHPIVEPADIIANSTVFPYTEKLMDKYETDETKKEYVKLQIEAFRRLVEESKK
jgi:hypothetical protein